MEIRAENILRYLTKEILGAINFDDIPKWEIEGEKIPKTFFSDRLRNNPGCPINKEVIGRLVKLYQAQLGIYKMKEPINDVTSCSYANKLLHYISSISKNDLSSLKNYPSQGEQNRKRRETLVDILLTILNQLLDKEKMESDNLYDSVEIIIDNYELNNLTDFDKIQRTKSTMLTDIVVNESEERLHLVESKGFCPRCRTKIIRAGDNSIIEAYEFITIDKTKPDSPDNKIVVCKNCFEELKDGISDDEKLRLMSIKKQLCMDTMYANSIDSMTIEKEIENVLSALVSIKRPTELIPLNYHPKKVDEKIDDDFLLCDRVRGYVVTYFNFVGEKLKNLNKENKVKYFLISNEVKIMYVTLAGMNYSKNDIFDIMTDWLMNKSNCTKRTACEIVIAYYVQNCEVFGEITE